MPSVQAATLYYKTTGTNSTWTSSVWSSAISGPYDSAWVTGSDVIFNATSLITSTSTTVGNITANADVSVAAGGSALFSNTLLTVAMGKTFTFAGLTLDTLSAFTKEGGGTLTTSIGNAFTGGFTLNAGIVNLGGGNAIGGGVLNINGGTLQSNSSTARAPVATQINVGGNFTIGGENTGALTFNAPINLGAAPREISVENTTSSTVFSGIISGDSGIGFKKLGGGQLNLSGAGTNSYNGLTTVSGGTLGLGKTTGLNAFGGDLTIDGGNVIYSSANNGQIPDTAKVTISSGGLTMGARVETIGTTGTGTSGLALSGSGAINISSGTLNVANSASMGGGSISISGGGTLSLNTEFGFNGGAISLGASGTVDLRAGSGTGITYAGTTLAQITGTTGTLSLNTASGATTVFNVADAPALTTEMSIAAAITGAGKNFEKTGTGRLALEGVSTFTGTTRISSGTLEMTALGALTGSGSVVVNGGTLLLGAAGGNGRIKDGAGTSFGLGGHASENSKLELGGVVVTETLGALSLTAGAAIRVIDFGANAVNGKITFDSISNASAVAELQIWNWAGNLSGNGGDQLLITSGSLGGSGLALSNIKFFSGPDGGGSSVSAQWASGNLTELVPVPEVGALFGALGLLAPLAYRERRHWMRCREARAC